MWNKDRSLILSRILTFAAAFVAVFAAFFIPTISEWYKYEMTYEAASTEDFRKHFENQLGFVKAMWCGEKECEEKIKEDLGVTSRCIPFEQKKLSDTCVCCGKPAKKMVIWAKAY